jgi:integrase
VTGGVRKRGSTWTWYTSRIDPATGKRRYYTKAGFATKKAAQEALSAAITKLSETTYVQPSKLTVGAFLQQEWLPATHARLRPSTRANYETNLSIHVVPALGQIRLQQLTPARLATFYGELLAGGRRDGKGLAPKTVRNIHALLHRALRDAVRWGYLARNVADAVDPPRLDSPEMQVWTPQQLRAFLTHVRHDRLYALWLLVATTGMRRGEVAGLRWSDVDFTTGRVSPRRPRVVVNYAVHEGNPKTAKGRRSLALDPATVAALRDHQARQAEEKSTVGSGYLDSGLVFTWPDGRPLHPDVITGWFKRHARKVVWSNGQGQQVGLPPIRLHDVRHSYASAALAAGIPAKVVSERLGHAAVGITLDTYSHVLPGLDERAADVVARLILQDGSPSASAPGVNSGVNKSNAPHPGREVRGEGPGHVGGGGGI